MSLDRWLRRIRSSLRSIVVGHACRSRARRRAAVSSRSADRRQHRSGHDAATTRRRAALRAFGGIEQRKEEVPRYPAGQLADRRRPRRAPRRAAAGAQSDVCRGRDPVARHRDRRQRGDVFDRRRVAAEEAAGPESRRTRAFHRGRRASVPHERTDVRALRTAARHIAIVLCDGSGSAGRTIERERRQPGQRQRVECDDARGVDLRQLFFHPRHHRGHGPHHRARRQHRAADRRRQRRVLAGAPERRSRPHGAHAPFERHGLRRRWGDAAGILRRGGGCAG